MLWIADQIGLSGATRSVGERISFNSKSVLLGLFALVGIILLIYTVSILVYDPEQTGRLNAVFIAAISGTIALGGTLISQLWGRDGTDRPVVIDTDPVHNAVKVNLGTKITAGFNKLMNAQTINKTTFTLKDEKGEIVPGDVRVEGGRAVFDPQEPLKADTTYRATVTKDVKDTNGNSLESDKIWSFSTGEKIVVPLPAKLKAEDKQVTTRMNQPVPINLEVSNADPKKSVVYYANSNPMHGSVVGYPSKTLTYTPKPDYTGDDTFRYNAQYEGSTENSNAATVTIKVEAATPPTPAKLKAEDKQVTTRMNQPVPINLEVSNADPKKSVVYYANSNPMHGSVVGYPSKTLTYTPKPDYTGDDTFRYNAQYEGSTENSNAATVTIKVEAATPPTPAKLKAEDKQVTTRMNQPVPINLEVSNADPKKSVVYYANSNPMHGSVVGYPSKTLTYTPKPDYTGDDTFRYNAQYEGSTENSNAATVTIKVEAATPPTPAKPTEASFH